MYHRIADDSFDPWGLAVSPENFEEQLGWIASHRRPIPLAKFAALHRSGRLPRDAVAVTFDDGYACTALTAIPKLREFGVPATMFLPASLMTDGREFWWDELQSIVLAVEYSSLRIGGNVVHVGEKNAADDCWPPREKPGTSRQQGLYRIWSTMRTMPHRLREERMEELRRQLAGPLAPRESHRPMTRAEIRAAADAGVDIGSHGLSHASLPVLSADEKAAEIRGSLDQVAELSGERPQCFAFPHGEFDDECIRMVEQAGFACACTTVGNFVTRESHLYALPRLWVGNWKSQGLARLLGAA